MWLAACGELLMFALALVMGFIDDNSGEATEQHWHSTFQTILFSVWIIPIVLLLIGLSTNRAWMLLPHLAYTIVAFFIDGILGIRQIFSDAEGSQAAALMVLWIVVLGLVIVEVSSHCFALLPNGAAVCRRRAAERISTRTEGRELAGRQLSRRWSGGENWAMRRRSCSANRRRVACGAVAASAFASPPLIVLTSAASLSSLAAGKCIIVASDYDDEEDLRRRAASPKVSLIGPLIVAGSAGVVDGGEAAAGRPSVTSLTVVDCVELAGRPSVTSLAVVDCNDPASRLSVTSLAVSKAFSFRSSVVSSCRVSFSVAQERCCAGKRRIKSGTWTLALVELVGSVAALIASVAVVSAEMQSRLKSRGDTPSLSMIIDRTIKILLLALLVVTTVILIFALSKNQPLLILPHWIFSIVFFAFHLIVSARETLSSTHVDGDFFFSVFVLIVLGSTFIAVTYMEYRCYVWMKNSYR
uniref:Uncharacterized protein n=1 Tax=Plectus sambesii TaxID=2011161 RepID=A0A914UMM3_9BILA